jgi:hypothetical protein
MMMAKTIIGDAFEWRPAQLIFLNILRELSIPVIFVHALGGPIWEEWKEYIYKINGVVKPKKDACFILGRRGGKTMAVLIFLACIIWYLDIDSMNEFTIIITSVSLECSKLALRKLQFILQCINDYFNTENANTKSKDIISMKIHDDSERLKDGKKRKLMGSAVKLEVRIKTSSGKESVIMVYPRSSSDVSFFVFLFLGERIRLRVSIWYYLLKIFFLVQFVHIKIYQISFQSNVYIMVDNFLLHLKLLQD